MNALGKNLGRQAPAAQRLLHNERFVVNGVAWRRAGDKLMNSGHFVDRSALDWTILFDAQAATALKWSNLCRFIITPRWVGLAGLFRQ